MKEMFGFALLIVLCVLQGNASLSPASIKDYCVNIDHRLPCSVPEIHCDFNQGAEFGSFVGKSTADQIKSFYDSDDGCPAYQDLYDSNEIFRNFIHDYMEAHRVQFPEIHAELVAMADSAHIKSEYAFIQNGCSELGLMVGTIPIVNNKTNAPILHNIPPIYSEGLFTNNILGSSLKDAKASKKSLRQGKDHCSDVGLIYSDAQGHTQVVQGHNEDWWATVAWKMSVVFTPDTLVYMYPGQLPGTSFVTNNYGLTLSMNSLYPLTPGYHADSVKNHQGISYLFSYALRSIVTARTTSEVISRLSHIPIYSGYSLNVMSACEQSIANLEGYGNRVNVISRKGKEQSGSIPHFNAYLNTAVDQENGQATSIERLDCYENSTIDTTNDVRSFIGNLTCPVFMTSNNAYGYSETLQSWVASSETKDLKMYRLPVDCEDSSLSGGFQTRCESDSAHVIPWNYKCNV